MGLEALRLGLLRLLSVGGSWFSGGRARRREEGFQSASTLSRSGGRRGMYGDCGLWGWDLMKEMS